MTRIGIAAAGSGGHVYPALAVAEALGEAGVAQRDIVFFGGDRMEAQVVPAAGYRFIAVDIHGMRRSLSVDNLRLPFKVMGARKDIRLAIEEEHLDAMAVFGGYVAGPAALAASSAGIPLVVHEANAVPGVANRMIASRADTVYAAFEPATAKLKLATVIGSPLRREFTEYDRARYQSAARERYGIRPGSRVVGIVGGSLGAQFLNELARSMALSSQRDFHIVHVTGPSHYDEFEELARNRPDWTVVGFEEVMIDLYAAADLVVCRGGALTMAELAATHSPAVIVPLPAGKGYQSLNAADLKRAGGAVVVAQDDPAEVESVVAALIADAGALESMSAATSTVDHGRAASVMAAKLMEVGNG